MPSYLLRVHRDEDSPYVMWSDIVEAPLWIGDRDYAIEALKIEAKCPEPCCYTKQVTDRIDPADRTGTSGLPGFYEWDDKYLIFEQTGMLPRDCLAQFCWTLFEVGRTEALVYLQPFEDDLEPVVVPTEET